MERSNAEGVQFEIYLKRPSLRMPVFAPEVLRLQAQEAQLSTKVSNETKSRDGVTNTVAESPTGECSAQRSFESNSKCKRIYANEKSWISTSKFELSHAQTKVTHLRSSVERESIYRKPVSNKIFNILREENLSLARGNLD